MNSDGKRVIVVTGKMRIERRRVHEQIMASGHVVGERIDRTTDLLVVADGSSSATNTTKAAAARKAGVPIIEESSMYDLLAGRMSFAQALLLGGGERQPAKRNGKPASARKKIAAINRKIQKEVKAMGRSDSIYRASF